MKTRILAGLLAGILLLSCAACGKKPQTTTTTPAAVRDTLNVAITTDPEGLDPQKTSATSTQFVTMNIFETLVVVDENWNITGRLAESYEVAPDNCSVTFHLKKGVKFHNGQEMKAADVKASIDRLHENDSSKKKYYTNIKEGVVVDEYTIRFETEKPDAVLLTSFAYPWSIIFPASEAENLKTAPVGTGAYKFVSWTPQQDLKLTRFADYHGTAASIENVHYQVVPDVTTAMSRLLNGTIDLVDVTGSNLEPVMNKSNVTLFKKPVNSATILGLNLKNEKLANVKVRQAMAAAIDKDAIIQSVNQGFGDKLGAYLPSMAEEYIDTNSVIPYDLENAKKLLAEAGYPDGFSITLTLPKTYAMYTSIGLIIADQLKKIGINCEVKMVEWADWMSDVYTNKNYDMTVMANSGRLSSYDFISRFHSQSNDYISYLTGEADEILDTLKNEQNLTKRTELIKQFQQLIAENVPVVPIETQHRVYAMSSAIAGYVMYPTETTEFRLLSFTK